MKKIFKENYLFLILFIILIFKDSFYNLLALKEVDYTPVECHNLKEDYNKLLEFNEIDLIYESESFNTYIIYKDIYNYLSEITIRGGKDKNLNNNPVIYDNTLVGVIKKVDNKTSTVKLLPNKDTKISVKIGDALGILEYQNGELIVRNISNYDNINLGDNIYTSGLGNINENIFVGEVSGISLDSKNIEKIVKVKYNLQIKDIDYVTVLKNNKGDL